jgi:hypothetical protein
MSGAIHPLPQYAFMAWCLLKAQGQLYLYLAVEWQIEGTLHGESPTLIKQKLRLHGIMLG